MSKPFADTFRNSKIKITKDISDGTGFIIGSPEDKFELTGQVKNRWTYVNKEKSLKYEQFVQISGQAIVITGRLENTGSNVSDPIKRIEPLNLVFSTPHEKWKHIYANGGTTEEFYPPTAYRTHEYSHGAGKLMIESEAGGRSSNLHLPLLISLTNSGEDNEGLFCGMEWSAAWYISFSKFDNNSSQLLMGIKVNDLTLNPGEVLKLPDVHIGFFKGGPDEATNHLRRYLYENVCAKYQGKPTIPPVSYDHWFGIDNKFNCELLKKQALRASELGIEVFVVDAAWFAGGFPDGVGNWEVVDQSKFPNGIEELAEFVKGLGMGLGLWFEVERVCSGTKLYKDHPEWHEKTNHLNLARTDVQEYLINIIGGYIERLDLKWSRWDYNTNPMKFWMTVDPTLKIQFNYMEGLYRVLDQLMNKYPEWRVEGCASGGRRIDIGTMKRAHTFWFSDSTCNPLICRYMQARANRFLPGHLLNSSVATETGKGDTGLDDAAVLSRMLGKLAFDGDIASWSPEFTKRAAVWVKEFKNIRHLMVQDFFQLLPMPTALEDWDAVQFMDYSREEAIFFAFCGDKGGNNTINLKGLDREASYLVSKIPVEQSNIIKGADLMNNGFDIKLRTYEAGLWYLKKLDKEMR